jgi:hypothetical protein
VTHSFKISFIRQKINNQVAVSNLHFNNLLSWELTGPYRKIHIRFALISSYPTRRIFDGSTIFLIFQLDMNPKTVAIALATLWRFSVFCVFVDCVNVWSIFTSRIFNCIHFSNIIRHRCFCLLELKQRRISFTTWNVILDWIVFFSQI